MYDASNITDRDRREMREWLEGFIDEQGRTYSTWGMTDEQVLEQIELRYKRDDRTIFEKHADGVTEYSREVGGVERFMIDSQDYDYTFTMKGDTDVEPKA